jgi:hypothetical protein
MEKVMEKACEMFHDVLRQLTDTGRFSNERDVETAKAAVSGIVKIKTLEAMENFEGNSHRMSHDDGTSNRNSYGEYSNEGSYRRGRGMNGQFVSRDDMRDKMESMLSHTSGEEKEMLRQLLSRM